MNAQGDGGSAFPNNGAWGNGYPEQGMTLRDYFAAHAPIPINDGLTWKDEAKRRYEYADAMLRARTK